MDRCELCEAARLTEWYYEDDECWIAECESCSVPMVVWRHHDPDPPDDVKARLRQRLLAVAAELDAGEQTGQQARKRANRGHAEAARERFIDDNLRSIPGHYHAHARPRRGWW